MQPSKKRKLSPPADQDSGTTPTLTAQDDNLLNKQPPPKYTADDQLVEDLATAAETADDTPSSPTIRPGPSSAAHSDRLARFAALKSRSTASARSNLAEAKAEANRAAINPALLANLSRKSAIASHNLLKADTEADEGDGAFERRRAWDYTIEESEKWDERMAEKKSNKEKRAFQDFGAEAAKVYDRQIKQIERLARKDGDKTRDDYERQKAELIENAARSGGLEVVEMENGEMVAIDKEGRFYADTDSLGFVEQKPKRENVDRLVEDIRKAEEVRLKKRKDRGQEPQAGDITYINEKNKQFNMKLARFYDRYTTEIRDSFERGTAL